MSTSRTRLSFMVAAAAWVLAPAWGQSTPPPAQTVPSTRIETTTQEVVLDLIVRDKRGRLVRDLKPEEIEVIEDDLLQKLNSFRLVEGREESGEGKARVAQPAAPVGQGLDPLRQIRLITLVFDNLGADGKRFSRQAVNEMLNASSDPNLYFSIFTIGRRLHLLQDFTTSHEALKKEMERAQRGAYIQFESRTAEIRKQLEEVVRNNSTADAATAAGPPGPAGVQAMVEARVAQVQLNALQLAESLERDQSARSSLYSLLALAREQGQLPGRKMLLYFTEHFIVPEHLLELFRTLMSEANRANVSVYCVDARGLVTSNQNTAGRDLLASAAQSSQAQLENRGSGPVTPDQVRVFDTLRQGLRSNVQTQLGELATGTGGFLISNTNDLRAPLRRAVEEIRTYYEAAYTPHIASYDGKFRNITVRVTRPDVIVQSRKGYFALPPGRGGQQLFAYEMPLLNAVNEIPHRHDVEYRAAAERFDPRGAKVRYSLTIEVPMKGLKFEVDKEKKTATTHASLLALFKNAQGEVVSKFSRDLPMQAPLDKVEAFRNGNLIQTHALELPAGRYTLETAVVDRNADKAGAKSVAVVVPQSGPGLAISDIILIRRIEPLHGEQDLSDPLHFEGGRVTPTLSDVIPPGPGGQVSFYFTVYPASGDSPPELTLAFYQGGQLLGEAKPFLPKANKNGRIPYVASIPAEKFSAGQYEMRAIVNQGAATAEENIFFAVQR